MYHFFNKNNRRLTFLVGFLLWRLTCCLSAQGDDSTYSSIGFFDQMVGEASASGEAGEARGKETVINDKLKGGVPAKASPASELGSKIEALVREDLEAGKADPVEEKARPLSVDEQLFASALSLYHSTDYQRAIAAFVKVLNYEGVRPDVEKKALIYLARIYYQLDMPLRTISLMDMFVNHFPQDARREAVIFQIGKIHRELGQYEAAIAAFYRVLNAIILAGEDNMKSYLDLARKAQFEIARTHFDLGEWAQALDLFERIALFELGPEDQETLRFYKVKSLLNLGRRGEGLRQIEKFASQYPKSPFLAELQYEKARAEIDINRVEAGRKSLMDLVEMGGTPEDDTSGEWIRWRRVAGNFLSNYYYKLGEFEIALRLYQAIVVMDDSPQWQLPIVMQMAGCFRQLGQYDRAAESLRFVVGEIRSMRERSGAQVLSADFEFLENSASWHLNLIEWREAFAKQLQADAVTP